MSKAKVAYEGTGQSLLKYAAVLSIFLGMFFWVDNLYMAFWLRRFFVGLAGLLAVSYLGLYRRDVLVGVWRQKLLTVFLLLSTLFLLITTPLTTALFGSPLVHPSLVSLYASVGIGLFLTIFPKEKLLEYIFHGTVAWAVGNFAFWLLDTHATMRLGFLDSQVIYAACLFAIGVMIGLWLYRYGTLPTRYVQSATGFLALCLLLSQTRSALLIMVFVIFCTFVGGVRRHWRKMTILAGGLAVTVVILGGYFGRLYNWSYFVTSVEYRVNLIQASLPDEAHKLVLGSGIGSIDRNIQNDGPRYPLLKPDIRDGIRFESSHNYFVDLVVERGLIVAALLVALCVAVLRRQRVVSKPEGIVTAVLVFLVLFVLVNNINIQMEMTLWACIVGLLTFQRRPA